MFPYMIGKADAGSYQTAFTHSIRDFASRDPAEMAAQSGSVYQRESSVIQVRSLGQWLDVSFPDGKVVFSNTLLSPIWSWRLVVLNYLYRSDNTPVSNRLISYRELTGGQVFYPAFLRESIKPLAKTIAREPRDRVRLACTELAGSLEEIYDICAVIPFLPRFPVTVKIWLADEEMGGSANILFDDSANHYLHTEDIAAAGNLVSCFLVRQCELMT